MSLILPNNADLKLFAGVDLEMAVKSVEQEITFEHRDPLMPPYGIEKKITDTQRKGWAFYQKWKGLGPMISMIAAKGASKTHFGGCFALNQAQLYPGSLGCLVSNTFGQAKDNGLPIFDKIAKKCGIKTEFFTTKKLSGKSLTNVVFIYLAENVTSYMLIRSYEAIKEFEGVEIDWLWSEEGQDATYEEFRVPFTRNRGQNGDNAVFYAAMPEDGTHWQYNRLPELGMVEEKKFVEPDYDEAVYSRTDEAFEKGIEPIPVGIMYEFSVFENRQNVGQQYIQRNSMAYSGEEYNRYVLGQRGSSKSSKIFHKYKTEIHRDGFIPKFLAGFDHTAPCWLVMDFNVSPGCSTIWQEKPWNDKWAFVAEYAGMDEDELVWSEIRDEHGNVVDNEYGAPGSPARDLHLVIPANRKMYVQTGELECWNGGTQGMINMFIHKYPGYKGHITINGDASGNSMKSSASTTDWEIVRTTLTSAGYDFTLQPGLIMNVPDGFNGGEIKYSNPFVKDTLNLANALLMDNMGKIRVVFMPHSEYESKGAAASVGAMKTKPNGDWDERCDDKEGRDEPRTHFSDTFRYFAYLVTNGDIMNLVDDEMEVDVMKILSRHKLEQAMISMEDEDHKLVKTMTMLPPSQTRGMKNRFGGSRGKAGRTFVM